ncbi:hypothetical protein Tco_0923957 [Tanacetum coccineum]|uniref:Uncharacterized protein n=1 Tax=Tanacetum coccineum TaxID=301880 RepID=A0ABQ5D5M8_9ASTR
MIQLQPKEGFLHNKELLPLEQPPTRTQLRSQMMTYLKHVGNKKHLDLKNKTFEEIQALYEKVKRFDESFTVIGSNEDERKIKELNEGASDPDKKKKFCKENSQWELQSIQLSIGGLIIFYGMVSRFDIHLYEFSMNQYSEVTLEGIELILWGD